MLCARLYTPARIITIDTDEYRLKLAEEKGLADITLVPGREDIEGKIRELTDGRGADTVFEVAGGKDTFQTAWKIARPNAVGGVDGSYCQEIMDLTACGKLDAGFLITHRCRLDEIMEAYDVFENKKDHVIKYAVTP